MKTVFFFLFLALSAFGEPSVLTDSPDGSSAAQQNAADTTDGTQSIGNLFNGVSGSLSLHHQNLPTRVYIGEIVPVTIKLTPLDLASGNVEYTLQNEEGVRIFSDTPERSVKEDGVYDTFYFLVQAEKVRLPDVTATLSGSGATSETLTGTPVTAITLTPPATFAKVLADRFEIVNYKTTPYNQESNVVIFTAKAKRCNIGSFYLPDVIKQGFESKLSNVGESRMTYYAIIPKSMQNLNFSIFNLQKQRYESIMIPIIVDEDTVSTQENDLSPTDVRHTELKIAIAAILGGALIALFYWRQQKWALYASVLPMFYVVYTLLPNENVCVKKGSPVYLLPINHGTIFEMTIQEEHLEKENEVGDFTKIVLEGNKIGWVHKRDLCTN